MSQAKKHRTPSPAAQAAPPMTLAQESPPEYVSAPPHPQVRLWAFVSGWVILSAGWLSTGWYVTLPQTAQATFVGKQSCIKCHAKEVKEWEGSHHDLAMDHANDKTVLADFKNATLEHFGVTSRMYRAGEKFMIHTEGPGGTMGDFEVKFVFGYEPLQQYMVEFDRTPEMQKHEIARVQVLPISWDTKKKQWFYLMPSDVKEKLLPDDPFYWTNRQFTWQTTCAECHSTNLAKNFDPHTARYHTTFSEIDVSCEACHGPASNHVKIAGKVSPFWDRKSGYGLAKLKHADSRVQVQACAKCHSLRRQSVGGEMQPGKNYYDHLGHECLVQSQYYPDGQIKGEVFELGSFAQSKMYHKGIRCTDCHNPHTTKVKFQDNRLCTSCHQHPAAKYDTPAHHHHKEGSTGASCIECHMPHRNYMEVDPRRDHSLRIPRPDLSLSLGSPNACTQCHLDRAKLAPEKRAKLSNYGKWMDAATPDIAGKFDPEVKAALAEVDRWASERTDAWYGVERARPTHFGPVLAAVQKRDPQAEEKLIALSQDKKVPAIVRASAVIQLRQFLTERSMAAATAALRDPDPQVRREAIVYFDELLDRQEMAIREEFDPPGPLWILHYLRTDQLRQAFTPLYLPLLPLLNDPQALVRAEAARTLARIPGAVFDQSQRDARQAGIELYIRGAMRDNDRAVAHTSLAMIYYQLAHNELELQPTIDAYRTAIRVQPDQVGPRTELAKLLEKLADSPAARILNLRGPSVEQLRRDELALLKRDIRLLPQDENKQLGYVSLLHLLGKKQEAAVAMEQALVHLPQSQPILRMLAMEYRELERWEEARNTATRLLNLAPHNPQYRSILEGIHKASSGPKPDQP